MENYEQKKQELSQRFEAKKTNFLNTIFNLVKDLQEDLNNLSMQYREAESKQVEDKLDKIKK